MSRIKLCHKKPKNGKPYDFYCEVEDYRDSEGEKQSRIIRYLGKKLPQELNGIPLGFRGAKLTEGKRIQVRFVELGAEDFFDQVGIMRKIIKRKARVEFDNAIRGRRDWTVSLDWLGNVVRS